MKAIFRQNTSAIFDAKARAVRAYNLMQWARWATFGLYIVAVFMLYVSDVWGISTYLEKNSNEYIALGVFSITSFILAYFLASSKEAVYEDIAMSRSEGFSLTSGQKFAMVLFASAGILFELFSATSNQQHISNTAASQAGLLKPVEVDSVSINTPPALTDALMRAQANLDNCKEKVRQGRMNDCEYSEGKVAGAERAIEMSNQTAAEVSGEIVDKTNARNERLMERFDKPMFKVVGKAVGGDTNDGMIVAVAVLITIFELQHILSVFAYGNALRRMNADKLGKPPATATDQEAQAAPASMLQRAGETVAIEYARAQGARNKVHDQMQKQADQLADKLDKTGSSQPLPEQRKPPVMVDGFDMAHVKVFAPTDEEIRTGKTIRQRLREGEHTFPGDRGLDTPALQPANRPDAHPAAGSDALGGKSADEFVSDPANFALLKKYVEHDKFAQAFVGVATGVIHCSQQQIKKACKTGGDLPFWVLVILEAWDVVSAPDVNKQRQRMTTLSDNAANSALYDVYEMVLGGKKHAA